MVTGNDIEKSISKAIQDTTPDLLDTLMTELELETAESPAQKDADVMEPAAVRPVGRPAGRSAGVKKAGKGRGILRIAGLAAAVFALFIGIRMMTLRTGAAYAVVGLDVNPSIELVVDSREKVIRAEGINEEGKKILSDMDLRKTDLNVACNAILGKMVKEGYLSDQSNSVLVSVRSDDTEAGRALEDNISKTINAYLGDTSINGSILGQYVEGDKELEAFAKEHDISMGKALLIKKILATGGQKMTEDALLKLTTQELILLAQERKASRETNIGQADRSGYITEEKAVEAALAKYGIRKSEVTDLSVELDCDDGILLYEVEFRSGDTEYEVDIDAVTGEDLSGESERGIVSDDQDSDDNDDQDSDDDHDNDDDKYDHDDDDGDDQDGDDDDGDDHYGNDDDGDDGDDHDDDDDRD
ncbi:MAG: PepSY domain-containing protein [Eubacterium sp.]|nr:PepSY domain-containing protein [Eubacterium sp.]